MLQVFLGVVAVVALVLAAAVSRRRRVESARHAAEAQRYVTSLAAAAAHEINNPLTAVVGNLELIMKETRDPVAHERAELGLAAALRIEEIVRRMGRITRLRLAEQAPVLPEMLDLDRSSSDERQEPGSR